jgi:GT2 family glycosyltransferase
LRQIVLIVCTRNRPIYLYGLLVNLFSHDYDLHKILIVDSSDNLETRNIVDSFSHLQPEKIQYIHSLPGLPYQRNVGIDFIFSNYNNIHAVAFLDDDSRIAERYFHELSNYIYTNKSWVAVTGKSLTNMRVKPKLLRRIFLLDSNQDGKILKSGNTTLPNPDTVPTEVDWMPGLSMAINPKYLALEKFNSGLRMYFEDVEMSLRLQKYGKIISLPNMNYFHLYATDGRDDQFKQIAYSNGIRWELSNLFPHDLYRVAILWSIFGSMIYSIGNTLIFFNLRSSIQITKGHVLFFMKLISRKDIVQRLDHTKLS